MATSNKHVVFDVVGTLVTYEALFEALETRLGDRFKSAGIGSRLFGYAWMESGEKEYTYLSLMGKYVKFIDVFKHTFYRTLHQAGIKEPRKFASDEDRDWLVARYRGLQPNEGLLECFSRLRAGGFTVWCLTCGDTERVAGYLEKAGAKFPPENFVSCDNIGLGKPTRESYQYMIDNYFKGDDLDIWFAAAHMWDAAGARPVGFKGAWVSTWEKEFCEEIYGEMEVKAKSLPDLADGIVAYSSKAP